MVRPEEPALLPDPARQPDESVPVVPVLTYATPAARTETPKWVRELAAFFKFAAVTTLIGAFVLMLAVDEGHVGPNHSPRPLMALCLILLAVGVAAKCLRAPYVSPAWRLSTALAVPFILWQTSQVYVELAYMRDGWPWVNLYPDAREPINRLLIGLAWLAVSVTGFVRSRRRNRRAAASLKATVPRRAPG